MIHPQPPFYVRLAHRLRIFFPVLMLLLAIAVESIEEIRGIHTHFGPEGPHEGFYLEIFAFGLLGPVLVGLGFHWIARIVEQLEAGRAAEQRLRLELESQTQARRELLAATIRQQEAERQRVARELHDGIGQPLTAFLLTSENAPQAACDNPYLNHARRAAANTLEAMRRLILDLRPSLLDAQGLLPALRQCADDTLAAAGIQVRVTADGRPQSISDEAETALFRIGQEAFTNILRHARADRVNVRLKYRSDQVQLIVQDNGKGFDQQKNSNQQTRSLGLGLLSMQERSEQIGGRFDLQTQAGNGACVTVSIPLKCTHGEST